MATQGEWFVSEMRDFANFEPSEQRYIRRSLDVGNHLYDPAFWVRDAKEEKSITQQVKTYKALGWLRENVPSSAAFYKPTGFFGKLVELTAFDLQQGGIKSFAAYRFLYERLLGVHARPWLPAAFVMAAALPQIMPERRTLLLQDISRAAATAPGWSTRPYSFVPAGIYLPRVTQKTSLKRQFNRAQAAWSPHFEKTKKNTLARLAHLLVEDSVEFMRFSPRDQRFIKSSLEAASTSQTVFDHWARDEPETRMLSQQRENYRLLPALAAQIAVTKLTAVNGDFIDKAVGLAVFDLGQGRLSHFSSFQFLYGRLLGSRSSPWLPALYVGASTMPQLHPSLRVELLQAITENQAKIAVYEPKVPVFKPCWVPDKTLEPAG